MNMPPNKRPVIKIKLTKLDYALEVIAVLLLVAMWGFLFYYYPALPEKVPVHFGADGQPDAFGPKSMLLVLAITASVLSIVMLICARFPRWANYPVKVTEDNAGRLYRHCASLLRELGIGINITFLWIVAGTCLTATNQVNGLGRLLLPCVLVIVCAPLIYHVTRMFMAK
jgi:uncharacterized membrane protein